MAKSFTSTPSKSKAQPKTYKSSYGSHADMVITELLTTELSELSTDQVVAMRDGKGMYVTEVRNLDNGIMDNNRVAPIEIREQRVREAGHQLTISEA